VVLALARVTGEVGAGAALAGVVCQAGREFHDMARLKAAPVGDGPVH
jgi:hypothetical protein